MTKEEYDLWDKSDPWDQLDGWIEYSWESYHDGHLETFYMNFPNEKVAKAFFSAHNIKNYYQERI